MKLTRSSIFRNRTLLRTIELAVRLGSVLFLALSISGGPHLFSAAHASENKPCKISSASLQEDYLEGEKVFREACGKCHVPPDPSKPSCSSGLSDEDLTAVWNFMHETKTMGTVALDCLDSEGKEAYENKCSKCHKLPDPAKQNCISETPLPDMIKVNSFMEGVREGKDLYNNSCNGCHAITEPSEHSFDFWKKHLCVDAAGLGKDDTQKVLLYLKAAGKN